ncbi:DUF7868 domain-containing protein [Kitasatospora sp. NBC_01246]|uniref:DUF7868 domain-containing protein n=1 Tax=Kitasatospora sp. NBC_01246 TaxID=2903570 RepID=UPI003FA5E523
MLALPRSRRRLVLTVHDVRTDVPPGTPFHVLLNGPSSDFDPEGPYFVGWISFFGAAEVDSGPEHGGGRDIHFDVTEQVQRLQDQGLLRTVRSRSRSCRLVHQ